MSNCKKCGTKLDKDTKFCIKCGSYVDKEYREELEESNIEEKVQDINKISDYRYEVTTYEKYRINYGKENKSKIVEFSTKYTINKVNNKFKIYSIKDIQKLGEK